MERPFPAAVAVGFALAVVAALATLIVVLPVGDVGPRSSDAVGERELVRVTTEAGSAVEALAIMDTGASSSSIGQDVADELGLDLRDAPTVTVRSAFGERERPVTRVVIELAGRTVPVEVSVSDRSELPEPILVGRDVLAGAAVQVGSEQLTTPDSSAAPSTLESFLVASSAAVRPASLLAVLPLAAALIVVLRSVVGISTLGTFAPILLTVSFLQVGLLPSLALTAIVVAIGLAAEPLLRRTQLPRVARLSVLVGLTSAVLLAIQQLGDLVGSADSWGAAFPIIVAAALVEKLYEEWELEGLQDAVLASARTVGVAVLTTPVLLAPPVRFATENIPLVFAVTCSIWAFLAGRYRGLRLTELLRFGPVANAEVGR